MVVVNKSLNEVDTRKFPISIKVNGEDFIHYKTFRIDRNVDNFVDSFNLECNNPQGRYSKSFPVWSVIEFYYGDVLIFRCLGESKTVDYGAVGSSLTFSWREELLVLTEDDADPTLWPYKGVTDNSIISELMQGYSRNLELWPDQVIKEYAIPGGSTRKWQVIMDIVNYNDYTLIKRWNTIFKEKIPTERWTVKAKYRMTILDWEFHIHNTRIESVKIIEDITTARSSITGFTYQKGKKKLTQKDEFINTSLTDWSYARKLRNRTNLSGYNLQRNYFVTTPGKDVAELGSQIRKQARALDMKDEIVIEVYWFMDLQLLDTVDVQIEQEGIVQYMYIKALSFSLDQSNKLTTTATLTSFKSYT